MKARMAVTLGGVALMAGGVVVCRPAAVQAWPLVTRGASALTLPMTAPAIDADSVTLTATYRALRGDVALGQAPVPEGAGAALLGLLMMSGAIGGSIGKRRARREVERDVRKSLVRSAAKDRIDPEKQAERAEEVVREVERIDTLTREGWFRPNVGGWYLGIETVTKRPLYLPRPLQNEHGLIAGATGSGKCVTLDTLVWANGLRTFGDVWGASHIQGPYALDRVSSWYDDGEREGYKVETEMALAIDGTPDHRVWIRDETGYEGWCKLKNITTNAYVGIARGMADWGDSDMPLDEAYALGLIIADGGFSHSVERNGSKRDHLDVNKAPVVLERIAPVLQQWREAVRRKHFSDSVRLYHLSPVHANCSISGCGLHAYLENRYGMQPLHSYDKEVPFNVLCGTRQVVQAFLRGYFDGDGYCDGQIEASTASSQLAVQVQQLLIGLGVYASIRTKPTTHRLAYIVCIRDTDAFAREVGFTSYGLVKDVSFRRLLEMPRNTNTDTVPGMAPLFRAGRASLTVSKCDTGHPWYSARRFWERKPQPKPSYKTLRHMAQCLPDGKTKFQIERLIEDNRIWTRVVAITPSTQRRIDCTVEGSHAFVGNGFVNHNTARVILPWLYGEAQLSHDKRASLIVIDPKDGGEITTKSLAVMRKAGYCCFIYDPLSAGSICFNVAALYEDAEGVESMVEAWVRSLGDFHSYYGPMTVALIAGILLYLRDVERATPAGDWRRVSMADVARWNRTHTTAQTAEMIVGHVAAQQEAGTSDPTLEGLAKQMADLLNDKGGQAKVMGGVTLRTKALNKPLVAASMVGGDMGTLEWWEEFVRVPSILYMPIAMGTVGTISPVIVTGLTGAKDALSQVAARHGGTLPRPVRALTDEAANIGEIAGLPLIVSTARSIDFGLHFATQGPSDLKRTYKTQGERVMTSLLTHNVLSRSNVPDLEHYTNAQLGVKLDDLMQRDTAYIQRAGLRPTYVTTRLWFRDKRLVTLVTAAGTYTKADALREQLAIQQAGMSRVEASMPATIGIKQTKGGAAEDRSYTPRPTDDTKSDGDVGRERGWGNVGDGDEALWDNGELVEPHALVWD